MSELREAIEQAFNADEQEETIPEGSQAPDVEEQEAPESIADVSGDDSSDDETHDAEVDDKPEKEPDEKKPDTQQDKDLAALGKGPKAPASWTPRAREAWSKLPDEARNEVIKRENEINRVLKESSQARHAVTELNSVLAPYKDSLIAAGVTNPIQQVGTLLAVESRLRQGSQSEKALTVANLIKSYGIDIRELDSVLSSQGYGANQQGQGQAHAPQQQHNSDIERLLEERLAPVNQFLQQQTQMQQMQEMQERNNAIQTVEQFSQNAEFIQDVRMDMADLMDMAAQRGQQMTIEEAYNKACAINPEIAQIMKQREDQQRLMNTQNTMQRKRSAASSISGRPMGPSSQRGNDSLRDSILDAWDSVSGA